MNKLTKLVFLLLVSAGCSSVLNEVGKPYKGWKEGEFDIHHIHTGMGEANFFIMPDGTSMLIDAGDLGRNDPARGIAKAFPPIAECEFHPGKYVANYVLRVNPNEDKVDYFMSSHFHTDHLCNPGTASGTTEGRTPDYAITGVTEAGEYLSFGKFYDRGYPEYNYPLPVESKEVMCFRDFVSWQIRQKGACQEQFVVGRLNQISMKRQPQKYAGLFSIRNIAANAEIWTGNAEETVRYYDLNPENITGRQNENTKSIALRIDFGPFSYYTGGDVAGKLMNEAGEHVNIEALVGEACGEVDVCKTNHHAYKDAMTEGFIDAVNPDHYVSCAWDIWHTQPALMERLLTRTEGMIFHQALWPEFIQGYEQAPWYDRLYRKGGHVVVKAYDKGRSYKIYVLDSSNEDMIVKDVFGPFDASEL